MYKIYIKKHTISFQIDVIIKLTNIQGRYITSKIDKFEEDEIKT